MSFLLSPIDTVESISPEAFRRLYLQPRKPVIIKSLTQSWPALQKWNFDYMKQAVGDISVPLYDSSKADPAAPINAASREMRFGDYIDLIQREPTDLRIFLFDPIKYAPKLLDDYVFPTDLMGGFLDKHPNLFFGGQGSETFLHYDLDLAHIFHSHFCGRKRVLLFAPEWKQRLYHMPYATYALEDYDITNPDFERFPALKHIEGIECTLEHGDTLFMPSAWWHWMQYVDCGFSVSLRAWDKSWRIKAQSLWNLTIQRQFDNFMKAKYQGKYMDWKEQQAWQRAEKALKNHQPK